MLFAHYSHQVKRKKMKRREKRSLFFFYFIFILSVSSQLFATHDPIHCTIYFFCIIYYCISFTQAAGKCKEAREA
jgi:hypothetical protein